jgi:hypothetical protein
VLTAIAFDMITFKKKKLLLKYELTKKKYKAGRFSYSLHFSVWACCSCRSDKALN